MQKYGSWLMPSVTLVKRPFLGVGTCGVPHFMQPLGLVSSHLGGLQLEHFHVATINCRPHF